MIHLQSLYLRNFRNLKEINVRFGEKINLICGRNAQGKTNLLEALILLSTGRSFRTQHLSELIREGATEFFLEAIILEHGVEQTLKLFFDGSAKRVEYNATRYPSFQSLLGILPSTLFAPHDLELIVGSPAHRRRFLNLHLAQSDPLYLHHLMRYTRSMKQRNCLLKQKLDRGIEVFEKEMARSAAYLFTKRKELLFELDKKLEKSCELFCFEKLELRYFPSPNLSDKGEEAFFTHFQKMRSREKEMGLTLVGPHRDDFLLLLEKKPARLYASEGQKRTSIAALRLAQWQHLKDQIAFLPLFGVDDFEMHLDAERQKLFQTALGRLGQVFVTSPHLECAWDQTKRLTVEGGVIS